MTLATMIDEGISRQKLAADPQRSVWVSASAGSGKTRVLVERCLRLMLNGTQPEKILCITFTKAAAAEMANRLNSTLGDWSVVSDQELEKELMGLIGHPASRTEQLRARQLFARVLDAPGGLKIQTIHSFCESILGRFPLEANLSPNFEVMDERTADEIMQTARDGLLLLSKSSDSADLSNALQLVSEKINESSFSDLVRSLSGNRSRLKHLLREYSDVNGIVDTMSRRLGVALSETEENVVRRATEEEAFDGSGLRQACEVLLAGTNSEVKRAGIMSAWLAQPAEREKLFSEYRSIFLTKDGSIKAAKNLATKKSIDRQPDILEIMICEAERLQIVMENQKKVRVLTYSVALLRLGLALLDIYEAEKTRRGKLDYDDLILKTRDLLSGENVTPWVMFKLDGGIEHILVDEAQDTSPDQWQVIGALAEEFFHGLGAAQSDRTVFVVGDEKQSIYSFQGADPAVFDIMRRSFEQKAHDSGKPWKKVPLDLSFRSTDAVLDLVDTVFEDAETRLGLTSSGDEINHLVKRAGDAGLVEIWPTVKHPDQDVTNPWDIPVAQGLDTKPEAQLAKNIAQQIRLWLDEKEILSAHGRPIAPKDIMILVQKRNAFFSHIVRALKLQNIPVAGTDRMVLTEQIAVMDLMALAKFVLLPEDDLNLAIILKSPFVGCDDNQLFELAFGRKGSLWRALRDNRSGLKVFDEACIFLRSILAQADYVPVYEFFADILGKGGGRRKLLARLGDEAADPIEEFLSLALNYQRTEATSLQAFLHWVEAGAADVKRDMEQGRDEVRILTVHGSKGLQSPIIFLPDTCQSSGAMTPIIWTDDKYSLPLWPAKTENDDPLSAASRATAKERQQNEKKRLLYVALTRAEDRLYICGWEGKKRRSPDCWYEMVDRAFEEGVEEILLPWGDVARRRSSGAPASVAASQKQKADIAIKSPPWVARPAQDEPMLPHPLTPSREEDEPPIRSPLGADNGRRFHRGLVIHRLLESLPAVTPKLREQTARNWLSRPVHGLNKNSQEEILRETLAVINDLSFGPIFGEGSRAEVPVTGVFGDQVMSGQIDRLLITEKEILIVDYKTNRPSPRSIDDVPKMYLRQMSIYHQAMSQMYPGKPIKLALLWTDGPHLMMLPHSLL
ncbi:double-strand break repair helicase AddA [Sneathiella marina]|uniref:DNA 3'-5' helicase n=1 Tax=Sneathiella marina TaxID=2950108 RepID=A0ABY4W5D9_9PROT|nr:double-strand break repair helicase AddA [Sneathiella marina]USG61328.1 double-strand break repair helicase AddA [Sneathiella marina]